jgi:hypothetical protein
MSTTVVESSETILDANNKPVKDVNGNEIKKPVYTYSFTPSTEDKHKFTFSTVNFKRKILEEDIDTLRLAIGDSFGVNGGGQLFARGAKFQNADINIASISNAIVSKATIADANLTVANIADAVIKNVKIYNTDISEGIVLRGQISGITEGAKTVEGDTAPDGYRTSWSIGTDGTATFEDMIAKVGKLGPFDFDTSEIEAIDPSTCKIIFSPGTYINAYAYTSTTGGVSSEVGTLQLCSKGPLYLFASS